MKQLQKSLVLVQAGSMLSGFLHKEAGKFQHQTTLYVLCCRAMQYHRGSQEAPQGRRLCQLCLVPQVGCCAHTQLAHHSGARP